MSIKIKKTFSDKIRAALVKRRSNELAWTQRWLAQKTGINEVELSNKINGITDFSPEEIEKISRALGIDY